MGIASFASGGDIAAVSPLESEYEVRLGFVHGGDSPYYRDCIRGLGYLALDNGDALLRGNHYRRYDFRSGDHSLFGGIYGIDHIRDPL
jgi:hypothetical protein